METKTCKQCNINKNIEYFSKKYKTKSGIQMYQPKCKDCVNHYMCSYRNDKLNIEKRKDYDKKYYNNNVDKKRLYKKNYNIKNKDKISKYKKVYSSEPKNKSRIKEYQKIYCVVAKEKIKDYRKRISYSSAWRRILHRTLSYLNTVKEEHTETLLGYNALALKEHIESLFTAGMTWDNYGEWEIDHIKPISLFEKDSLASEVNALSNLQPLWKKENREKHNKY